MKKFLAFFMVALLAVTALTASFGGGINFDVDYNSEDGFEFSNAPSYNQATMSLSDSATNVGYSVGLRIGSITEDPSDIYLSTANVWHKMPIADAFSLTTTFGYYGTWNTQYNGVQYASGAWGLWDTGMNPGISVKGSGSMEDFSYSAEVLTTTAATKLKMDMNAYFGFKGIGVSANINDIVNPTEGSTPSMAFDGRFDVNSFVDLPVSVSAWLGATMLPDSDLTLNAVLRLGYENLSEVIEVTNLTNSNEGNMTIYSDTSYSFLENYSAALSVVIPTAEGESISMTPEVSGTYELVTYTVAVSNLLSEDDPMSINFSADYSF